ncbi:MAG: nucleotidyl transferase AbiEii/AbiGii toxin family protein [Candidatus Pacebacteria bacterium]|nr:nucleotidyl transferase AbiEii/AbiGii toxin family protein [Candidatus Paceibacterota bacterium]
MITLNSQDAIHKAWLYRVLIAIVDNSNLRGLYFKGGTCASMAGFLDRFSVDLDFDYVGEKKYLTKLRYELENTFENLGLEIKDASVKVPQFFLKYPTKNISARNTLKIDINFPPPKANVYKAIRLVDIDRVVICQDIATMFANKLVAVLDRFDRNNSIAGRDIYDIHHFFINDYDYNKDVIIERTGLNSIDFFKKLSAFITDQITETILSQDLNQLIPYERFNKLRKILKRETIMFLNDEIVRLKNSK